MGLDTYIYMQSKQYDLLKNSIFLLDNCCREAQISRSGQTDETAIVDSQLSNGHSMETQKARVDGFNNGGSCRLHRRCWGCSVRLETDFQLWINCW